MDMEKVLRETFSLKDFLNCEKTSQILQDNWYLDFTSKYEGKLEELYETERKYFRENISTLFYYDTLSNYNKAQGHNPTKHSLRALRKVI